MVMDSMAGNNLTGFASHFAKQFLLDAKQLQNIVAQKTAMQSIRVCRHVAQCKCYAKMVQKNSNQKTGISYTHVTLRS